MRIGRTLPPAAAPLTLRDVCRGVLALGAGARATRDLEHSIQRHFGVRHVFLVSSGTAALALTLLALRSRSSRTAVVIPAYTCFSVPAAVLRAGLRPVLCDVNPQTFDYDHALLARVVGADTLCVLVHHLFGIPSDVERVRALCRPRGIFVVEDAAQAMGVQTRAGTLGTLGDVGVFSLGRGKYLTCGSGGIIVTRSDEVAALVEPCHRRLPRPRLGETVRDLLRTALMSMFVRPRLYWIPASVPALRLGQTIFPRDVPITRLPPAKAALMRGWEARLRLAHAHRAQTSEYFGRRLSAPLPCGNEHPYLRLPVLAASDRDRAALHAWSRRRGLGLSPGYPSPVNEIPEIRSRFAGQDFPIARLVADRLVTLPTHQWVSDRDRREIAARLP